MRRILVICTALVAVLAMGAAPSNANWSNGPTSAGIVERDTFPEVLGFADFEDGLVALVNVNSVLDACLGVPAVAFDRQTAYLASGSAIRVMQADVPIIVIPLAPPPVVCANPGFWQAIALTGSGRLRFEDNDATGSGTRANPFGVHVLGAVQSPGGQAFSVKATYTTLIKLNGEQTVNEDIHLVPRD